MAEIAFLNALSAYLAGPAGVTPALVATGYAVPGPGDTFPSAALSLAKVERVDIGLGGGATEVSDGALQVISTIDLANPVLAGTEGFSLLDAPRTGLTLPHGGLIRADGLDGALSPSDITITVAGTPRDLVANSPGATEFTIDPQVGQVSFGVALPAAGALVATYRLGIWERSTTLIRGVLDVACWDTGAAQLASVSDQVVRAILGAVDTLPGLQKLTLLSLGPIGDFQVVDPFARARPAQFRFEYEHVVDVPISSGGIIARVAITAELTAFIRDPGSGAMIETTVIETDE